LKGIVTAMIPHDPGATHTSWLIEEAKRIAALIAEPRHQAAAWLAIAKALAPYYHGGARNLLTRATRTMKNLDPETRKRDEWTLVEIVKVMVTVDLEQAVRTIRAIDYPDFQDMATVESVQAMAAGDPDRAERVARHIVGLERQATALTMVAKAVAVNDPDNASWLVKSAKRIARARAPELLVRPPHLRSHGGDSGHV
jgi:hypothetical protein